MVRLLILAAITPLCGNICPTRSAAEDIHWPGWRGPARDGWVEHFEPPDSWPKQLTEVWEREVGEGYSSPVVAEGKVFQQSRLGEQEVVWCLDLASGDVLWREGFPVPFQIGGGGEFHGKGPKSSPAYSDGRLFTLSITGVLSCWDTESGDLQWRRDESAGRKRHHPYWGASTSPLVDGDLVIVHLGSDKSGALTALKTESGEVAWRYGDDGASYASPILIEIDHVRQIVQLTMDGLVSVESQTGERLWEFSFPQVGTDQNMVTPAFHDGLVLLGGENRGMLGLQPIRQDGAWSVRQLWHQNQVALDMSSAVVNDDLLFGFSHYGRGRLFCLDPRTGEVLWQGPGRTGENVAFLAVPGYIVALIDNGRLEVLEASGDQLRAVASYNVSDDPTWAPPVLLTDGVLVKDRESVKRWSFPQGSGRTTPPGR